IIEAGSFTELMDAMAGDATPDESGDLEAFARWQKGEARDARTN
ncbi:hypothetical protein LCGC14_2328890, partial [marine sediment metagenome]